MNKYSFHRFFLPRNQFVYNSFRFFSNNTDHISKESMYTDGSVLSQYLDFHYSTENYFNVNNFHKTCAELCVEACREHQIPLETALDAGCAVGRCTFELAKLGFGQVIGVDSSKRFLKVAHKIQNQGRIRYTRIKEGELYEPREIDLNKIGLYESKDKVIFDFADLDNFETDIPDTFNLVFSGNLICRMKYPKKFLQKIDRIIRPGGMLVVSSTYSWMRDFTNRNEWVGGFLQEGKKYNSYQALQDILLDKFVEVKRPKEVEFVIRENKREYIHSVAEVTFWKRKE